MSDSVPPDDGWDDVPSSAQPTTRRSSIGSFPGAGFPTHGARLLLDGSGAMFRVYAPERRQVELVLYDKATPSKELRRVKMQKQADGFFASTIRGVEVGGLYRYAIDGGPPVADPASRFQPHGVEGPSQVWNPAHLVWTNQLFRGCPLEDLVLYEVHVGTATKEGTFRALIEHLPRLHELGVTALELMPIAEFAGARNWGYDGVFPFAPCHRYGTPADFAALVDAAHQAELAVILDVVYNHVGPLGSTHAACTAKHFDPSPSKRTPWGPALGFDDEQIRAFILENASHWIRDFHVDGLRLDAAMYVGSSAVGEGPAMLTAIAEVARAAASEREVLVIAEDNRNDARVTRETSRGGLGLDAVWTDDLHHVVRRLLTAEDGGALADFHGTLPELVKVLKQGWLYEGQIAPTTGAARGTPAFDIPPSRIVQYLQNHDLIGNRPAADRLSLSPAQERAAAALLLCTPYTPLLFMGQEHGTRVPFPYFVDFPASLAAEVAAGRARDVSEYFGRYESKLLRDPNAAQTFEVARADRAASPEATGLFQLYAALLRLRREEPAMSANRRSDFEVGALDAHSLAMLRRTEGVRARVLFIISFGEGLSIKLGDRSETSAGEGREWKVLVDTEEARFGGTGGATLDGRTLQLRGAGAVALRSERR